MGEGGGRVGEAYSRLKHNHLLAYDIAFFVVHLSPISRVKTGSVD